MNLKHTRAFTLVEILIVVIILGILAAVVVPRFSGATDEAARNATHFELQKIRRAIDVYMARNDNAIPDVTTGVATWGALVGTGDYMKSYPINRYIPAANASRIYAAADAEADSAYQTTYGWIFNTSTGQLWAGSFDADDQALPPP